MVADKAAAPEKMQAAATQNISAMSKEAVLQGKDFKLTIDDQYYAIDPNVLAGLLAAQPPPQAPDANIYDGLRVQLAHGPNAGAVLVHANRIRTGQARSHAAEIEWPEEAAVTGNVLVQTSLSKDARCFGLNADQGLSWISVSGNVVRGRIAVGVAGSHASVAGNAAAYPFLNVSKPPATIDQWESVNTFRP